MTNKQHYIAQFTTGPNTHIRIFKTTQIDHSYYAWMAAEGDVIQVDGYAPSASLAILFMKEAVDKAITDGVIVTKCEVVEARPIANEEFWGEL